MYKLLCIELAIKEATNVKYFKKAKSFYQHNFYLLKNSGPLKASLKQACEALGITYYNLPKCHRTWFVNHRKHAFITTYQNASITTSNAKTGAKILGLLKKFTDVCELLQVEAFLDLLELVSVSSLVFEKKDLLPCEISRSLKIALSKTDRFINEGNKESNLKFFTITPSEKGKYKIERQYCKAGHERKKVQNREFICVEEDLSYSNNWESLARSNVIKVSRYLKDVLNDQFDDFNDKIYKRMKFYDPKFWDNADDTYGKDQITFLSEHFQVPLMKHNFILSKTIEEWQSFKSLCMWKL